MLRIPLTLTFVLLAANVTCGQEPSSWFLHATYTEQVKALKHTDASEANVFCQIEQPVDRLLPPEGISIFHLGMAVAWGMEDPHPFRQWKVDRLLNGAPAVANPAPATFTDVVKNVLRPRQILAGPTSFALQGDDDIQPIGEFRSARKTSGTPNYDELIAKLQQSAQEFEDLAEGYELLLNMEMASHARRIAHSLRQEARSVATDSVVPALLSGSR